MLILIRDWETQTLDNTNFFFLNKKMFVYSIDVISYSLKQKKIKKLHSIDEFFQKQNKF
jgi:hypothetical protein